MKKHKDNLGRITVVFLILLLAIVSIFSLYRVQELQKEQERVSYQAEAIYQRNFGELTDSIQTMNGQLAQLLVSSSQEQLLLCLSGLWREVYSAISSLSGLPVAMHELEQTDLLLNDVAEYSYYLMRKNVLQQNPLTTQDWQQLEDFYHRSSIVQQELDALETKILAEDFRMVTLSLEDAENPVATAFRSIEMQVKDFPEIIFEEGVRKIEPEPRPITGPKISEAEAIERAAQFLAALGQPSEQGSIAFTLQNTAVPIYAVSFPNNIYVEVSQAGGHVLQYYRSKELSPAVLTEENAKQQAENILQQLYFSHMVCVDRSLEGNIGDFIFVPTQDDVYLYPDMIKLQIALDDGTLLSFDQTSYQTRHYTRTLPEPIFTGEEVLQNRNPNFHISSVQLALITDEYSLHELLTYEIRGNIINESFSIFVDVLTGQEVRIVRL